MQSAFNHLVKRFQNNIDLIVACVLAIVSTCVIGFDQDRIESALNLKILLLLFCLMLVVAALRKAGVLNYLYLKSSLFVKDTRSLARLFIFLNFFVSMLVTNDVSLIIFVPLAIDVLTKLKRQDLIIQVLILQTIAANMGSTLTPIGNPQNLFIYTYFKYELLSFLSATLPIVLVCFVLLILMTHNIDRAKVDFEEQAQSKVFTPKVYTFMVLFVLCILCVLRVLSIEIVTVIVASTMMLIDREQFKRVDYKLLMLFVFLFVFVANISSLPIVQEKALDFVQDYEYFVSLTLSQIISNVPATVMLSSFTSDPKSLLLGVDVGGLGTIIASMASLITFKFYTRTDGAKPLYFMRKFTKYNLKFLLVLVTLHFVLPSFF